MPTALITTVTGQGGCSLTGIPPWNSHIVHECTSSAKHPRQQSDQPPLPWPARFHPETLPAWTCLTDALWPTVRLETVQPDEVRHLAEQHHVKASINEPRSMRRTTTTGTQLPLTRIRVRHLGCACTKQSSPNALEASPSPQIKETPSPPQSPQNAATNVQSLHEPIIALRMVLPQSMRSSSTTSHHDTAGPSSRAILQPQELGSRRYMTISAPGKAGHDGRPGNTPEPIDAT